MVDSKRYNPSNKRFQKHTQSFVEGKTMKGHLAGKDKDKNKYKIEGVLVRVNKNALNSDGWHVKIEKKTVKCNYGDNIVYLPPCIEQGDWYIPKAKCEVEVSIDEKSKIRTITKIKDPNKKPISMNNNGIKLEGSGSSALEVSIDTVKVYGQQLEAENDIKIDTTNVNGLPDEIKVTDMYKDIQELKKQISGNNVNGE